MYGITPALTRKVNTETKRGGVEVRWETAATFHNLLVYPWAYGGEATLCLARRGESVRLHYPRAADTLFVTRYDGKRLYHTKETLGPADWAMFFFSLVPSCRHSRDPWPLLTWLVDDSPLSERLTDERGCPDPAAGAVAGCRRDDVQ